MFFFADIFVVVLLNFLDICLPIIHGILVEDGRHVRLSRYCSQHLWRNVSVVLSFVTVKGNYSLLFFRYLAAINISSTLRWMAVVVSCRECSLTLMLSLM